MVLPSVDYMEEEEEVEVNTEHIGEAEVNNTVYRNTIHTFFAATDISSCGGYFK